MTTHQPYAALAMGAPQPAAPPSPHVASTPTQHNHANGAGASPISRLPPPAPPSPSPVSHAGPPPALMGSSSIMGVPPPQGPVSVVGGPGPQYAQGVNLYPHLGAPRDDRSDISASSGGTGVAPHDVLPLCPDDNNCPRVNDREHQKQYSHTCRLFPCFHAHLKYHTRYFRHQPGQAAANSSEDGGTDSQRTPSNASTGSVSRSRAAKHRKNARKALTSVSFTHISPDAPNAQKLVVLHGARAFEIAGDWSNVMLHTFKRYLYQVTGVRPAAQVITIHGAPLTDETAPLTALGVVEGTQVVVDADTSKVSVSASSSTAPAPGLGASQVPIASASTAAANPKIPVAWL